MYNPPMRGRHRRELKVGPPETAVSAAYLLDFPSPALYHQPEQFPVLDSPALFGNERPLQVDIGCETAVFLCHLAAQHPDSNFLGIELSSKPLYKAVQTAVSAGLSNIKFLRADFKLLYPLLRPHTWQAAYLHFPNPHTKAGLGHRRIFDVQFLDKMSKVLAENGRLSVMTDEEPFFLEMLELAEKDGRFHKTHPERYLLGYSIPSRYQRLWENNGRPPLRFELAVNPAT